MHEDQRDQADDDEHLDDGEDRDHAIRVAAGA
jgi:hypothetical protein